MSHTAAHDLKASSFPSLAQFERMSVLNKSCSQIGTLGDTSSAELRRIYKIHWITLVWVSNYIQNKTFYPFLHRSIPPSPCSNHLSYFHCCCAKQLWHPPGLIPRQTSFILDMEQSNLVNFPIPVYLPVWTVYLPMWQHHSRLAYLPLTRLVQNTSDGPTPLSFTACHDLAHLHCRQLRAHLSTWHLRLQCPP